MVVCFLALHLTAGYRGRSYILVGEDTFKGMPEPAEMVPMSYQVWNGTVSLLLSA